MSYHYDYDLPPKFIGAKLLDVKADHDTITLTTDRGILIATADGECCSSSWFESVDIDGIGGELTEFDESTEAPPGFEDPPEEDYECIKVYFGTIKTTKGRITYEMRNSSNGYYGGSIVWSRGK